MGDCGVGFGCISGLRRGGGLWVGAGPGVAGAASDPLRVGWDG